jgi:serine/threonine protein kinase
VWAFGVIVYEMLSGEPLVRKGSKNEKPWARENPELVNRKLKNMLFMDRGSSRYS